MWSIGATLSELAGFMPRAWSYIGSLLQRHELSLYEREISFALEGCRERRPAELKDRLLHHLIFRQLLTMDFEKRFSATQALRHPSFRNVCS